ncbi:MAG: diacylglycerol kinase family protein [Alphaproteobacteria bacterium]|nr:diacylglycerol kinase family protein [Alphaproteobacteria bacterium]
MAEFSIAARIKSIGYALAGIATMLRTQHNAWLHLAATVAVVLLAFALAVPANEWMALILAIVIVWSAEALNTAFERLCDVAHPDFHPLVKQAKDVAAAAVLIAVTGSVAVGLLIFGPRLIALF